MRESHPVLIPKKTKSGNRLPPNRTPVYTNYKILARILARRLEMAPRSVVGEHQICGFQGSNLHRIRTVYEAAEMSVMRIAVPQHLRRAFNQVDRGYLFTLLRHSVG